MKIKSYLPFLILILLGACQSEEPVTSAPKTVSHSATASTVAVTKAVEENHGKALQKSLAQNKDAVRIAEQLTSSTPAIAIDDEIAAARKAYEKAEAAAAKAEENAKIAAAEAAAAIKATKEAAAMKATKEAAAIKATKEAAAMKAAKEAAAMNTTKKATTNTHAKSAADAVVSKPQEVSIEWKLDGE
ncbi:MAG: hypothetical protein Q9M17_04355 [Mariprofundus sp.]|nr:hypothetical protein [Mariprofundus sp.]